MRPALRANRVGARQDLQPRFILGTHAVKPQKGWADEASSGTYPVGQLRKASSLGGPGRRGVGWRNFRAASSKFSRAGIPNPYSTLILDTGEGSP